MGDRYRFLHRSYLEYLVSRGLADGLLASDLTMWEEPAPLYTDLYEMIYQMLKAHGLDRIDMDWVMETGTFISQVKILTMAWRHHPPTIEPHVRKQMHHNDSDIVRFMAAMGMSLYKPSKENVEGLAAAFESEQNTLVQALMQRVASNWLDTVASPDLHLVLQSVISRRVELQTSDAERATLQRMDYKHGERVLLAARRAMMQGDRLWPAAAGAMLALGAVRHTASFSYIHKVASAAQHREIRTAYKIVQPFTGLPNLSAS